MTRVDPRGRSRPTSVALLALICLGAHAPATLACSCGIGNTDDRYERSHAIFIGKVTSATLRSSEIDAFVAVVEILKGSPNNDELLSTGADSASCGFGEITVNESYLFFVDEAFEFGLCGGTRRLATGFDEVDDRTLAAIKRLRQLREANE